MKKYLALMMSLMMAVTVFLGNGMTANAETLKYELFLEDDNSNNPQYKVVYALSTDLSNRIDMKDSTFHSGDVITYQQESAYFGFLYTVNLYIDNNNNPEGGWTTTGASGTVYSYTLRDNVTVTNIVLESFGSGSNEHVTANIYLETITGNQGGSGNQGSSGNQGGSGNQGSSGNQGGSSNQGGAVNPGSSGTDSG